MKICLVGSILRHTVESDAGTYSGWGGMTESAIAPFAVLLDNRSVVHFVGSVGKEDLGEIKEFYRKNYPFVDTSGIFINPTGTDHHSGNKHWVKRKIQVEPTKYEHIKPHINNSDAIIFNFGNIDDIDPEAIKKVKKNSNALIYVDVHRKPFGADENGFMYIRGWQGWENYLRYADVVQMDKNECEALFGKKIKNIRDAVECSSKLLSAGVKKSLITLGRNGVLFSQQNSLPQFLHASAVPCKVIDTTGCGDAFAAGYLVSHLEGKSSLEAIKFGSLMAAINCEFVGYMKNIDRQMVNKRIPTDFNCTSIA